MRAEGQHGGRPGLALLNCALYCSTALVSLSPAVAPRRVPSASEPFIISWVLSTMFFFRAWLVSLLAVKPEESRLADLLMFAGSTVAAVEFAGEVRINEAHIKAGHWPFKGLPQSAKSLVRGSGPVWTSRPQAHTHRLGPPPPPWALSLSLHHGACSFF